MDWKKIISELLGTGMTQTEIAKLIDVPKGSITQILRDGAQRGFRYEPGMRLVELHRTRVLERPEEAQAQESA